LRHRRLWRSLPLVAVTLLLALPAPAPAQEDFTEEFFIEDCSFSNQGRDNRFWSLHPGDQLVLEGEDEGETVEVTITVLPETETVQFTTVHGHQMTVHTRVIQERELVGGELAEVSRNFFARCRQTNDIFYFGEDVDIYEEGEIVSHEGAWRAGEDDAQPGIIMPGTVLLGARYFQEIAPDVALDQAENTGVHLDVEVPAGAFERCVQVMETSPLDPDAESEKLYCPGVGLVVDDATELVGFSLAPPPDPPAGPWLTATALADFQVKVRISTDDTSRMGAPEVDCDAETVCVSGAVPGRVEALVRVPGPRANGCFWPTITKLTTSTVEVWVEQISTGDVRYYLLDGSSPGSNDLGGLFDRLGFCP